MMNMNYPDQEELIHSENNISNVIQQFGAKFHHWKTRRYLFFGIWTGVFSLLVLVIGVLSQKRVTEESSVYGMVAGLGLLLLGPVLFGFLVFGPPRPAISADLKQELANLDDIRDIGLVIDLLKYEVTCRLAQETLTRLLPRLRASDAPLLDRKHYILLHRALHSSNMKFILIVLQALNQLGDCQALPQVERLAKRIQRVPSHSVCSTNVSSVSSEYEQVREAACECLLQLRAKCLP